MTIALDVRVAIPTNNGGFIQCEPVPQGRQIPMAFVAGPLGLEDHEGFVTPELAFAVVEK